jgi:hypothetical protein
MIIINTVNSTRFSVDGIPYLKNYISEVAGSQITIFNAYDRKDVRVDWEHFGNITLNGVVYGNVADLQSALLPIIYTRNSLGGAVGIEDIFAGTNVTIDKTDPSNPIISATGGGGGAVDSVNGQTGVVSINLQSVTDEGNTVTDGTSTTTIGQGTIEIDNDEFECLIFSNNGDITGTISNTSEGVIYATENLITSKTTQYRNGLLSYTPNGLLPINLNIPHADETDGNTFATREWAVANITGGGATNLGYTPSPTDGTVTSDTGTDATIPLADGTNAGLTLNNLTNALKSNYDSAYTWVNTNGATVLSFISNIATTIRGTVLTGLSTASATVITSADTVLSGFGKLQAQITSNGTALDNRVKVLLNNTTSTGSLTGALTETQMGSSYLIPANTFASGDTFTLDIQLNRNATAVSTVQLRARINTTNTFAGATQIAIGVSGISNFSCPLIRTACFKTASDFEIISATSSTNNDATASSATAPSTVSFDTTIDNYIFFSAQLFNAADSFYLSRVSINKRKLKTTI